MYNTRNPYAETIRNAENLQTNLWTICRDFELAIEQRHLAIQAHTAAKAAYEEQEAEVLFELSFSDEYKAGKNAETRKMVQDLALIKARTNGPLRTAWGALNQATNVRDNAELAFAQMDARFKTVCVAAELLSSMLRAAALG